MRSRTLVAAAVVAAPAAGVLRGSSRPAIKAATTSIATTAANPSLAGDHTSHDSQPPRRSGNAASSRAQTIRSNPAGASAAGVLSTTAMTRWRRA